MISKDLKKGLEKLSNEVSDTFVLQAVDLLTKPEIDELRKLVSMDNTDAEKYASARMKAPLSKGCISSFRISDSSIACQPLTACCTL